MNSSKVSYWVELAEYDLKTAEAMLNTQRYLYVGFMCHQAIEKLLKAKYIKETQKTPPFTHNLSLLGTQANIYDKMATDQKDLLDNLGPLNIEARYPTDKEKLLKSLTPEKCKNLISETRGLAEWIKKQLYKLQRDTQKL